MSWDLVISSKGYRARTPEGQYLTGVYKDFWRLYRRMQREKNRAS